ncbi:MAG TPA: hypothetical protein VM657_10040 [Sphingomonas sp.]|nr:hypothetical protein [Sphingomonas sp.]
MKGITGQVLDAPSTDADGQPVIGILIGSFAALALWGGIVGLISLIV